MLRKRRQPQIDARSPRDFADGGVIEAEIVGSTAPMQLGDPCPACSAPREGASRFCGACGSPLEPAEVPISVRGSSGSSASALPSRTFECKNCGSQVATSLEQRSYSCPFCDSHYVTEISVVRSGRQRPEFIIGFAVPAERAQELFFEWLGKNSWLRPGDLAQKAIAEKQKGVYLPFWHFSMQAHSRWSAQIGEYWYRTETYTTRDSKGKTVTRTRRVREVEWFPLDGRHRRYYFGFLVPATRGITAAESRAIQPYQLSSLDRYRPHYLAGWMAEEYSIEMEPAIAECKQEFSRQQMAEVARFLPGDTHSGLNVSTELQVNGSDLILLPVHVLSYRYRERVFRFLVNGQTGKIVGQKPYSVHRIGGLIAVVALVIAAVVVMLLLFAR